MYVEIPQWVRECSRRPESSKVLARTAQCSGSDGINALQRFVKPQGLDLFLVH